MKKSLNLMIKSRAAKRSRSLSVKSRELLSYAQKVAETTDDWMQVFNAIYAPGAMYGKLFPSKEERIEFARTAEHKQLYELLWKLRDQHGDREGDDDPSAGPSGSFVVRMPRALHAALVTEAEEQGVSLNLLCVSKLAMKLSAAPANTARGRQLQAG
jgi:predicted HicB family RNase H-like nuclease